MKPRNRAWAELALACAMLVAAGASWAHTRSSVAVAPVIEGQPATMSVIYHPQLLVLTLWLVTLAGVLGVVGVARLRRAARRPELPGASDPRPSF
ncbi:hypothetical protein MB901379_00726 [Mycobacterium basiliense]|uniref:Transmembrane protein n=1 Tax=Mycobacterium basiliense TaxID=2094119 RepID=A0A3S4CT32_9MYCO|nr:hypothetical protein [Mycobacterium basiliense]VDM87191.1 hypothetical protein MB901379_00726 [Mycobacterium basiliense]